jgi:hypothetical protein
MADTPEATATEPPHIVAGSSVYFSEKSPHYLDPENAEPMDVQEIVNAGASAVCTRKAEPAGTWPLDELRLDAQVEPHAEPKSVFDDPEPPKKKFR